MNASDWVYVSPRYLLFRPPGRGVYHVKGRAFVPLLAGAEPDRETEAGIERVWARCGRLIYRYAAGRPGGMSRYFEIVRLDIAQAMDARPCRACHDVDRTVA